MNDTNLMDITNRNWLTKEEATAYIGKNSEYYLEKWRKHLDKLYKGWNWSAAIFQVQWMAYRKMYIEAVIIKIAVIIIGIVAGLMFNYFNFHLPDDVFRVAIQILIGFFANGLYRKKAMRCLQKTRQMEIGKRLDYLAKKGGTSILGLFVFIGLEIIIILIIPILMHNLLLR